MVINGLMVEWLFFNRLLFERLPGFCFIRRFVIRLANGGMVAVKTVLSAPVAAVGSTEAKTAHQQSGQKQQAQRLDEPDFRPVKNRGYQPVPKSHDDQRDQHEEGNSEG